jgi:hypothetical protein
MSSKKEVTVKTLMKEAKIASVMAKDENFALGLPVLVIQNNALVMLYPDGTEKIIKKLKKPQTVKLKKTQIKIEQGNSKS